MEPYSKLYRKLREEAGKPIPATGYCARTRINGRLCYAADDDMTMLGYTEVMLYAKVYASFEEACAAHPHMEIVSFSA
jgi:hypothetical protein